MAVFKAEAGCEVLGQAILSIVDGMGVGRARAVKILAQNGIDDLKPDTWYSLQGTLSAFQTIFEKIGPNTVKAIGAKIPANARFPPEIDSIVKALDSIDMAYKMNHRGEGFGSYKFEPAGPRKARMICENPYPCDMDQGLIEAMADRFRPKDSLRITVQHAPGGCRHRGDDACTYEVSW